MHQVCLVNEGLKLGILVDFSDTRVQGSLAVTDALDVGQRLLAAGFFVHVTLASHFRQVVLSRLLFFTAAHPWLHSTDFSLLGCCLSAKTSLFNARLDLLPCQELPLLQTLIGAFSQSLSQRAELLGWHRHAGVDVFVGDIVLHPINIERSWLFAEDSGHHFFD